jgi:hypothetical protein
VPNPGGDPYLPIHWRLVERDPTAPADLAEQLLSPLMASVRRTFPNLSHETLLDDAVVDAVLSYAERPEQFDPAKLMLMSYLTMSAKGDVLNAIKRRTKRQAREVSLEVVEDFVDSRNTGREQHHMASADEVVIDRLESGRLARQLRSSARTPQELTLLQLIVNGERRTARFAAVLGLQHLTEIEQRRVVKQAKDRLKKRIERMGQRLHE